MSKEPYNSEKKEYDPLRLHAKDGQERIEHLKKAHKFSTWHNHIPKRFEDQNIPELSRLSDDWAVFKRELSTMRVDDRRRRAEELQTNYKKTLVKESEERIEMLWAILEGCVGGRGEERREIGEVLWLMEEFRADLREYRVKIEGVSGEGSERMDEGEVADMMDVV